MEEQDKWKLKPLRFSLREVRRWRPLQMDMSQFKKEAELLLSIM